MVEPKKVLTGSVIAIKVQLSEVEILRDRSGALRKIDRHALVSKIVKEMIANGCVSVHETRDFASPTVSFTVVVKAFGKASGLPDGI